MKRIWLVRHGATEWSDAGRFNGSTDVPLNERGRDQARSLGHELARLDIEHVWTSDRKRSIETALLALARPATTDARLRELDFGRLEGKRWDECPRHMQHSLVRFDGFAAPGGESVDQLSSRVREFLRALAGGTHLLVTHGGVIRALLRAQGADPVVVPCCELFDLGPLAKEMLEGA